MKFINIPLFIFSLSIGIFIAYITTPPKNIIFVYPTPDNEDQIQYKDSSGTCFKFTSNEISCPTDKSKIREYPMQNGNSPPNGVQPVSKKNQTM